MNILARLGARGNGYRQIVKDMDEQPLAAALLSLVTIQTIEKIGRLRVLEAVKKTTAILILRANMLEAGLIKVSEDENTLLSLIEGIELPRSQSDDIIK
jgi:hypothetical protein